MLGITIPQPFVTNSIQCCLNPLAPLCPNTRSDTALALPHDRQHRELHLLYSKSKSPSSKTHCSHTICFLVDFFPLRVIERHQCSKLSSRVIRRPYFYAAARMLSDRQLRISTSQSYSVNEHADIRSNNGYASRKPGNCAQEVAEQNNDSVRLDQEPDKRPPK
jgi:hypothetical protein